MAIIGAIKVAGFGVDGRLIGVQLLNEPDFFGSKEISRGQGQLNEYHDGADFHVLHEGHIVAFFLENTNRHDGGGTANGGEIASQARAEDQTPPK